MGEIPSFSKRYINYLVIYCILQIKSNEPNIEILSDCGTYFLFIFKNEDTIS